MKTTELLERLRRLKVRLWIAEGELKCSAPKGALTPDLRAELAQRKPEIVALLGAVGPRAAGGGQHAGSASIARLASGTAAPLTFQQQRLWFLQQLEPDLAAYNIPLNWTLKGELDVRALERALGEIVRRHEIMRTVFEKVDGLPVQVVQPAPRIELRVERDPDGLPVEVWRRKVLTMMMRDGETAFDIERGPLYRARLFRVRDNEHILYVPVHHAIFDGVSIGVFLRELIEGYEAYLRGAEPVLPELPIQYADFAAWQRQHFARDHFNPVMDYWRKTLAGRLPVLELPTDRPRPPVQTYNGAHKELTLPWDLIDRVTALASAEGATLYMVLLATYKTMLHAYTGQSDIIVGSAINGRNHTEVEELIGFFVNTLVLRTDASGDPTFRQLLQRVRDVCLGAYEHYDVPFEWLVEEVQPERNLSYSPIFQTLFLHELEPDAAKRMGALVIEPETKEKDLSFEIARNDLTFWISFDDKDFIAWAEYNTDLFDGDRIERMLRHFQRLLEEITRDPDRPLSAIQLLPEAERKLVVETWNDTARPFPERPIHVQFEEQVDRSPDATALIYPGPAGDETLSYRELDRRATRLARHLRRLGVEPGALVGLCLERAPEMVVAQLAILKAGAAYVPLDPAFPVERLKYMVVDAALALVVTRSELVRLFDGLESPVPVRFVDLDRSAAEVEGEPDARFDSRAGARDRMYVIYTSGSTGRPKGVELEHRSVSNFLASMAREPGFRAGERLLAVTTLSFDIAVLELVLPLVTGGTVILAPKEATADGAALAGLIERLEPDVMQATPATWRMLLLSGWAGRAGLRLFSGGEALPRELAEELLTKGRELWNLYGPTETTIWSTAARVTSGTGPVPIGRPIASTQVYVLDRARRPVPIGVPGELWIAGDGLARGYLGRPELTAERFVPDPFAARPGARMYLTGDRARWRADGTLECLGRTDNQIKLRGYRIELGEIEAVVAEHAAVRQCVAIVREDVPGDQRLTAYCTPAGGNGAELDVEALRALCRERLPAYMVPAAFVPIADFPLTPNAKVDRLELARRPLEVVGAKEEYVAPRNELETAISAVWGRLLGREQVPIHANFFDLGGHSLLLAEMRVALTEALGRPVSVIELFQYPTVAGLAAHLAAQAPKGGRAHAEERAHRGKNLSAGRQQLMRRREARG